MPYALIQDLHGAGLDEYDRVLAEVGDDPSSRESGVAE